MALIITADVQSQYVQSALARAAADRADGRIPSRQADGTYSVPSSSQEGVTYTVKIHNLTQLQASCTCEHGQRADARGVCRHAIAAMASEVRRLGGKYVVRTRKEVKRPAWIVTGFAR